MKKLIRIISMLLTVLLLLGALSSLSIVSVFAAEDETVAEDESTADGDNTTEEPEEQVKVEDYLNQIFATPEEKLATMELRLTKGNYQLYVDDYSGEVATKNTVTGDILFTNPYDVGSVGGYSNSNMESTKEEILSQLIIDFKYANGDTTNTFTSYEMAASRDQIKVKNIKNGIRVEYTMGREQAKMLVPKWITAERFEKLILEPLKDNLSSSGLTDARQNFIFERVKSFYRHIDNSTQTSDKQKEQDIKDFPISETTPIYVFDANSTEVQEATIEDYIKTYCPDYTYEELEYDHDVTGYVAPDENPPLFRLALEYTLDENGMSVRLPANGIRFNESLYQLQSITVLPYMGAGNSSYTGSNFYPDGSGTLFNFEDITKEITISGKVYGTDYAYHTITGKYQQIIRYPVFGIYENAEYYTFSQDVIDEETEEVIDTIKTTLSGAIVDKIVAGRESEVASTLENAPASNGQTFGAIIPESGEGEKVTKKHGYMAIIEEGDALTEISTYHAGAKSDYNTIKMKFNPRPSDSYNLAESISVGTNTEWTVVSDRKYVGSYKIKYTMLSDGESEKAKAANAYDASWFGMAVAYRDYLTSKGVLSPISADQLTEDIPLYIETFGALETLERVMSFPVWVMTPLTTFDNVKTMYEDMVKGDVKNVNFKLTGYANGGLYETVPYKFKVEDAVGGEEGLQDLLNYAANVSKEEDYKMGIFPNFDFAYEKYSDAFDGISEDKHVAKTIDDRYASRRGYYATQQRYINYYEYAISPAYFSRFYEKLTENYLDKYDNVTGISVATLGYALNSDFDEDEPYNREDSKYFTIKAFEFFDKNYDQVMTDGGNAYTWKYVDHMLDVALDSSRYNMSSAAVPFIGVVLHGSIQFAGQPLNMEGNMEYAKLKAIENGASPYFVLSYQNTQNLKDDWTLSEYYSVRYDIWKSDLIEVYNELNDVLGDVQDKYIIGHEFSDGYRVPDSDELKADILAEMEKYFDAEVNAAEIAHKELLMKVSNARASLRAVQSFAKESSKNAKVTYENVIGTYDQAAKRLSDYIAAYAKLQDCISKGYDKLANSENEEDQANYKEYTTANNAVISGRFSTLAAIARVGGSYLVNLENIAETLAENIETASVAIDIIADAEKNTVMYEEGKEGDVWSVTNYDELSPITQEAINCVRDALTALDIGTYSVTDKVAEEGTVHNGEVVATLDDGTEIYRDGDTYYSGDSAENYVYYTYTPSVAEYPETVTTLFENLIAGATENSDITVEEIMDRVVVDEEDDKDNEKGDEDDGEEVSRYFTENIVIVTYGDLNGTAYKYVILNYNNYAVNTVYNDIQYTIPAYGFVPVQVSK